MKVFLVILAFTAICAAAPLELDIEPSIPPVDFVKGFLQGIHETKQIEDLMKCLQNMDQIFAKIKEALDHMLKFSIEEIITGLKLLKEAMFDFMNMLTPCMSEFEQLKKLAEAMKNWNFAKIAVKIMANAFVFLKDIKDAMTAFHNKDHETVGKCIGDIMYRIFLEREDMDETTISDFLKGFLEGLNETGDINELLKCATNLEHIIGEILKAFELISKMTLQNIIQGVIILIQAVREFMDVLKPCSAGFQQIKKLMEALKNVNFMKVALKIFGEIGYYFKLVKGFMDAIKASDYHTAGKDLGTFLYKLFLTDEMNVIDIELLAQGFVEGINQGHNIDNVEKCTKDIPIIVEGVKAALEQLKNIDWKDLEKVVETILAVTDAFRKIVESLKPCSKVPAEIGVFIKKLSEIDVNKLLNKILGNIMQLIHDITQAINKITVNDFEGCGKDLGDMIYKLVLVE